ALKVRYIYVPAMVTCFLIAVGVDRLLQKIKRAAFALSAAVTIALFVFNQGLLIAEASVDRAELSREERVPFRTIAQRHPQFSPGTYLYFINGWAIYWSTMFQMRYGQTVQVEDIFTPRLARFADRQNPILIYFNARGDPTELAINPAAAILKKFSPPLAFEAEINLTGYELPLPRAQRGEPLPLILYWQAQRALTRDYTVFVHLLNANAEIIQGVDSQPRGGGAPTSKWEIGTLTPDGILLPIPSDAPPGIYRVEIGLYDLPTLERLQIRDANGARVDDKIVIESIEIVE
ncbi:MAG: hypothetical protein HY070_07500, partial [Chloroflexi bacterium]|nr:hypothetical protein [Chloroflexota bacterium]